MTIEMAATLGTKETFFSLYELCDNKSSNYTGKLLQRATQNSKLDSRYDICNFLLDEGADPHLLTPNGSTVLHLLLECPTHLLEPTINLCKRFLEMGVDPNVLNSNRESAIVWLINLKFTDDELQPLYDAWFSYPQKVLNVPSRYGCTPIELAQRFPLHAKLLSRMLEAQ